jgi:adenylosuccinate lyase
MIRALRAQVYTGFSLMKVSTLKALSPADGRYADKVNGLRDIFSEYGLIRFRVLVEVRWLQALADEKDIAEIGPLSPVLKDLLNSIVDDFSMDDAERVKKIEATTNHDVKAVEYFIREKLGDGPDTATLKDFLHFGCTSEDINNLAYALMLRTARSDILIPQMRIVKAKLQAMAKQNADVAMLSRTHGQTASPTTLGKEIANFVIRLEAAQRQLGSVAILGKFNGAVGNFNAHVVTYPDVDWRAISERFIAALGLEPTRTPSVATTRSLSTCAGISGVTSRSVTSRKKSPITKSAHPLCRTRSIRSISRMPRATWEWQTRCSATSPKNCPYRAGSAT